MDINPTYLKYFADAVRESSTQTAAKLNFVSQPAISQGIKKLEEQLGVALLHHKRKTIEPTHAGRFVLARSQKIFHSMDSFREDILSFKEEVAGSLRISISISVATDQFISSLRRFTTAYPEVDLRIKFGKTDIQKDLVESGKADLGIAINNGQLHKFKRQPIHRGKFLLVGKRGCPQKLMTTEERPEVSDLLTFLAQKKDPLAENILQVESWTMIRKLIDAKMGYGLVPDVLHKPRNGYVTLKAPRLNYEVVCFYLRDRDPSFVARKFVPFIKS